MLALERFTLVVRLAWTAGIAIVAGLAGEMTPGLAGLLIAWVLLTGFGQAFVGPPPRRIWTARITPLADFTFALSAIWLTGPASSPLWWSLLPGGFLLGVSSGVLAGLAFPSLGSVLVMAAGFTSGEIQSADLAGLGREVVTVVLLTPVAAGLGHWLRRRALATRPNPGPDGGEHQGATPMMLGLATGLNSELRRDRIPQLVVDLALGGFDQGIRMAVLLRGEDGFALAAGHPPIGDRTIVLAPQEGLLAEALASGGPAISQQAVEDPAFGRLGMGLGAQDWVCLPLMNHGQPEGALLLAHPMAGYFHPGRMDLLKAIGAQASSALNNARLVRELELERDRISETEEETRRKLARNLHDGPTQTIAAIAMRLNFARRLVRRDAVAAESEIQTLEEIARQTTKEIRHMLFTLRPLILESKGLVAALHQLASKLEETHGQRVEVEAQAGVADGLDLSKQAVIFFIAEEAVNNAHKHGEAANIRVGLRKVGGDRIALEVWDDGVGFNVGAVDANYEQRGSLGMVNMRERSELISGVLRIESAEGKGTHITLEVPLASNNG
jgi:signal transduction histidine kinase